MAGAHVRVPWRRFGQETPREGAAGPGVAIAEGLMVVVEKGDQMVIIIAPNRG